MQNEVDRATTLKYAVSISRDSGKFPEWTNLSPIHNIHMKDLPSELLICKRIRHASHDQVDRADTPRADKETWEKKAKKKWKRFLELTIWFMWIDYVC